MIILKVLLNYRIGKFLDYEFSSILHLVLIQFFCCSFGRKVQAISLLDLLPCPMGMVFTSTAPAVFKAWYAVFR